MKPFCEAYAILSEVQTGISKTTANTLASTYIEDMAKALIEAGATMPSITRGNAVTILFDDGNEWKTTNAVIVEDSGEEVTVVAKGLEKKFRYTDFGTKVFSNSNKAKEIAWGRNYKRGIF